jgi:hypothetical protein
MEPRPENKLALGAVQAGDVEVSRAEKIHPPRQGDREEAIKAGSGERPPAANTQDPHPKGTDTPRVQITSRGGGTGIVRPLLGCFRPVSND